MNRGTIVGLMLVVAGVAWAVAHTSSASAQGQRPPGSTELPSAMMAVLKLEAGDMGDHIVVVDPSSKVMSIYYIKRETGTINLRSVRNLTWDLQLQEYNPSTPSPKDIQAVIEGRGQH